MKKKLFAADGLPTQSMEILHRALERKLSQRGVDAEVIPEIHISRREALHEDAYSVTAASDAVSIEAGGVSGAFAAVGDYLRRSEFDGLGGFVPYRGSFALTPENPIHGMYFASHFRNYYEESPVEELCVYIEDLALRGCNALMAWYDMHQYANINDPESVRMIERLKTIWSYASLIGMKTVFGTLANEAFSSSPAALRAEYSVQNGYHTAPSHYHVELCPSVPGGLEEILRERKIVMDAFAGTPIDYISIWPYDQGGCTCKKCTPWGARGFLKTYRVLADYYREILPHAKPLCATWYFDRYIDGEWEAFREAVEAEPLPDTAFLFGYFANEEPVPQFIRDGRYPAGDGMISFPEISMYSATPWGGFGANPMPERMESNFRENRKLYCGALPYSEGIFEDLNKALMLAFYGGRTDSADAVMREYAQFEFCLHRNDAEDFVRLCHLLESTLLRFPETPEERFQWYGMPQSPEYEKRRYVIASPEPISQALALAERLDSRIPECMRNTLRWRVFLLRARIDAELLKNDMHLSPKQEEYAAELVALYHARRAGYAVSPLTREVMLRHAKTRLENMI